MAPNYPHLNQNKEKNEPVNEDPVQQDVIEDVSHDDELIVNGGGNGDDGDNKKNKSKKKKWPIFVILLFVSLYDQYKALVTIYKKILLIQPPPYKLTFSLNLFKTCGIQKTKRNKKHHGYNKKDPLIPLLFIHPAKKKHII